jgi:quercetin dioxygenase-like cupin family protein
MTDGCDSRSSPRVLVYSAGPGSRLQEALDLLASWATAPTAAPADLRPDERCPPPKETGMGVQPKPPTIKGPAEWFTGDVWMDPIVQPQGESPLNIVAVHFTPAARTAWHSHDGSQTLYVTEGLGLVQSRGDDIVEIRPGDVHVTADGQEHWHGATRDHFMTHISITRGPATWGEHVADDESRGPTD